MKYLLCIACLFLVACDENQPSTSTELEASPKKEGFAGEYEEYVRSVEGRYTDIANVLKTNGVPESCIELKPKDTCVIVYNKTGKNYFVVRHASDAYEAIQHWKKTP